MQGGAFGAPAGIAAAALQLASNRYPPGYPEREARIMSVTDVTTPRVAAEQQIGTDVTIVPIDTPTLGDRSYLVHDGSVALVIDPQRDIDRVLEVARAAGVRISHVFETHIHNDYVTGGL